MSAHGPLLVPGEHGQRLAHEALEEGGGHRRGRPGVIAQADPGDRDRLTAAHGRHAAGAGRAPGAEAGERVGDAIHRHLQRRAHAARSLGDRIQRAVEVRAVSVRLPVHVANSPLKARPNGSSGRMTPSVSSTAVTAPVAAFRYVIVMCQAPTQLGRTARSEAPELAQARSRAWRGRCGSRRTAKVSALMARPREGTTPKDTVSSRTLSSRESLVSRAVTARPSRAPS